MSKIRYLPIDSHLATAPSRRQLLFSLAVASAAAGCAVDKPYRDQPPVNAARLPRWRGFNLLEKFTLAGDRPYREWDFEFMAAFGFDYVRLPLDYRIWTRPGGGFREKPLRQIDQALAWGRRRGIHVTLCLHRAPGYCINPPAEPLDLWGEGPDSERVRRQFAAQWRMFAARYRGVPGGALSFNLVNEPPAIGEEPYRRVVSQALEAIRSEDPDRLVIADGRGGGRQPTYSLAPLGIAQAGRGYEPFHLTHYRAGWVKGSDGWPLPTWPLKAEDGTPIDKDVLWREQIEPWQRLEKMGVGILIGEWGAYSRTQHAVVLAWMKDCLENWQKAGWGWCLWNLRGDFGPVDSNRADVRYVVSDGMKVDAAMLDLLRQH